MALLGSGRNRAKRSRLSSPDKAQRGLTAAGVRIKARESDTMQRLIQPWQARAFTYYDIVPEIKYAAQFYSRALSVLRLYVAEVDDQGELTESEDPDAIAHLERIKDPGGGGRSGLLAAYGRLRFLTGECYLFQTVDASTDEEQWEMLSTDELRPNGNGYTRYKAPSLMAENYREPPSPDSGDDDEENWEPVEGEAIAYRLWNRHPRYSYLADSTMYGVLDVCEELVLLTQAVRARARSRLAGAGILLVNGSAVPNEPANDEEPEDDPDADPFTDMLVEAMLTPLAKEGTASAVVPIVVRVDVPKEDGGIDNVMKHIQLSDPTQLYPETGLRNECIHRLAVGLDMPPEVLEGMSTANHWTAWQVDEQTWKAHLQPIAQGLVDDLNSSYFQPSLKDSGKEDWQRFVIAFDASEVINHPDRGKDALNLHGVEAISDEALRDASGFDESDAIVVGSDEYNRRVGLKLRDAAFVKYGEPSVRVGGVMTEAGDIINADNPPVDVPEGASSNAATKKPPDEPKGGDENESILASLNGHAQVAKLLGASDLALHRARELAGSRIRSKVKSNKAAAKLIDGAPTSKVASILGHETVRALTGLTDRELVVGAGPLIAETLRLWRLDESIAEPLAQRIEQHAARTLYDENPSGLPETFESYVVGLHTAGKA